MNESHCANLAGDETCRERDEARRWCSACAAENDGCVEEPVTEPECTVDTAASTGSASTSGSTATMSATTTSTTQDPPSEGSSEGGGSTGASSSSSSSSGGAGPVCGDGLVEGDERCDGRDLGGFSCEQLGLVGGTLACDEDCSMFDISGCDGVAMCGNGMVEGNERCDGRDLAGNTCLNHPDYAGGEIGCTKDCELDVSECDACRDPLASCSDDDQCCSQDCGALSRCN